MTPRRDVWHRKNMERVALAFFMDLYGRTGDKIFKFHIKGLEKVSKYHLYAEICIKHGIASVKVIS